MSTDLHWFKSSYSGGQGGECLEIAPTPTTIHIRDSKTPTGPTITLSSPAWTTFLTQLTLTRLTLPHLPEANSKPLA